MAKRKMTEYVGISRNVIANRVFSSLSAQGNTITHRHKFKGLLEESIFKWIFNDAKTPAPHPYTVNTDQTSIYDTGPVASLAIAADWASDTTQSEKIGELIAAKGADYTAHLGDTYYSGASDEINANFLTGQWPMGSKRTFALLGNHEMYHGAFPYFDTLLPHFNQPNPFFCLRNDHWTILGLDTGYQSIFGGPSNDHLLFQDELMHWLSDTVKLSQDKRGIVILTHHQYFSAFNGEVNYQGPAWQIQDFFDDDREIIWIWGHEHRFSMYGKYKEPNGPNGLRYVSAYGRCIGHGGMPDEHTQKRRVNADLAKKYDLALWDMRDVDKLPGFLFFTVPIGANGYAVLNLDNDKLTIDYYSSYTKDEDAGAPPTEEKIVTEVWTADNQTGAIKCIEATDQTIKDGKSALTYADGKSVGDIGNGVA